LETAVNYLQNKYKYFSPPFKNLVALTCEA